MTERETNAETTLAEVRQTRAQIEELVSLLNPGSLKEDPILVVGATLAQLATAVRVQTESIDLMRGEIAEFIETLAHD